MKKDFKTKLLSLSGVMLAAIFYLFTATFSFADEKVVTPVAKTAKVQKIKKAKTTPAISKTILAVQNALNNDGFKLKVDGKCGKKTIAAIQQFQKKNGLKATGNLNKATLFKLGVKKNKKKA